MPQFATALAAVVLARAPQEASLPSSVVVATVRSAAMTSAKPKDSDLSSLAKLEEWASASGMELRLEGSLVTAWPRGLFGLRAELELAEGIVEVLGSLEERGRVKVSELPGRLRADVERKLLVEHPSSGIPPASVEDVEVTFGLHGWFELTDGGKSVWASASVSADTRAFVPARYAPLPKDEAAKERPQPAPRFEAVPGITVDLAWQSGKEPSVREKVAFADEAMDGFAKEVRQASDAVRAAYAAIFAAVANESAEFVRDALTRDVGTTADLPGDVRNVMRERFVLSFRRHGFRDAEEAGSYFDRASVSRRRARLSLEYQEETRLGRVGVSSEFSGPFTPRG